MASRGLKERQIGTRSGLGTSVDDLSCVPAEVIPTLVEVVETMGSGWNLTRLHLAGLAQRVPVAQRADLVTALARRPEDAVAGA